MNTKSVTAWRRGWRLTAQEVAHAMPVLQWAHPGLRAAPAPRLATIRHLAQRCGLRDGTLRTTLSRGCASGSLAVADGRYRLGPLSLDEAAAARALLTRVPGYRIAVVLEGERVDLPRLRECFLRYGLRPLQRSVWVGARTTEDLMSAALAQTALGRSVVVFQADEVTAAARTRLARLWRLSERAATLRRFHREAFAYLTERGLSAREAAWRCVEVAPVWYRVAVQDEPPFPLDLCGPDYPLQGLTEAWRAHLRSSSRELVSLWKSEAR